VKRQVRGETVVEKRTIHLEQNGHLVPPKVLTPNPLSKIGEGAFNAPSPNLGREQGMGIFSSTR